MIEKNRHTPHNIVPQSALRVVLRRISRAQPQVSLCSINSCTNIELCVVCALYPWMDCWHSCCCRSYSMRLPPYRSRVNVLSRLSTLVISPDEVTQNQSTRHVTHNNNYGGSGGDDGDDASYLYRCVFSLRLCYFLICLCRFSLLSRRLCHSMQTKPNCLSCVSLLMPYFFF